MLIRFVISNYLSFDEPQQFDLLPAPTPISNMEHHLYHIGPIKVAKLSAIYGANGAGKSNLIDALTNLQQWVKDGHIHTSINRQKFRLKQENQLQPASFLIEFYAAGKLLRYGLSIDDTTIIHEYLKDETTLFEHHHPKNTLHLSQDTTPEIKAAYTWITQYLIIMRPRKSIIDFLRELCTNENFFSFSNQLLGTLDTGLDYLTLEKITRSDFLTSYDPTGKHPDLLLTPDQVFITPTGRYFTTIENNQLILNKVTAYHHHCPFDLIEESLGTQKLLEILPVFYTLIHKNTTIFFDEIEQSIHPVMLGSLITKVSHTPTLGQLIFTTHESNLLNLDILRKDEIWFALKERATGATKLYSLSEFMIDNEIDPRKGYLLNRFGAIPFTASLELLNWNK